MLVFHFYYKIILNIYYVSFLLGLSIYFWYMIFINYDVCVLIFMTSPLGVAVSLLSI